MISDLSNSASDNMMKKQELIYGIHPVHTVLSTRPADVLRLFVQANRNDKKVNDILAIAKKHHIVCEEMSSQQLQKLVGEEARHQGVVIRANAMSVWNENQLIENIKNTDEKIILLVLDGVQDPHNLGACLRSANAFGAYAVIAPKDRAASLTDVVKKVACGAAEQTPFVAVANLHRTLQQLQELGVWFIGFDSEADLQLNQVDLKGKIGIVMGGEGAGLRRLTREKCDFLAKIPMMGSVESLNVSVATGIALYEARRQR
jgi:23S rRNA (guanosine2251-2'-O)-methyltransferase